MKCTITSDSYTVIGYKGKQVRDNIHSHDLVNAFYHFHQNQRSGEVVHMGGSRQCTCSTQEAVAICEETVGKKLQHTYVERRSSGSYVVRVRRQEIPIALPELAVRIRFASHPRRNLQSASAENCEMKHERPAAVSCRAESRLRDIFDNSSFNNISEMPSDLLRQISGITARMRNSPLSGGHKFWLTS